MSDALEQSGQWRLDGLIGVEEELPSAQPAGVAEPYDHLFAHFVRPEIEGDGPIGAVADRTTDLIETALANEMANLEVQLTTRVREFCRQKLAELSTSMFASIHSFGKCGKDSSAIKAMHDKLVPIQLQFGQKQLLKSSRLRGQSKNQQELVAILFSNNSILLKLKDLKGEIENEMLALRGRDDQRFVLGELLVGTIECIKVLEEESN